MTNTPVSAPPDVRECRIRASLLLKALRSRDPDRAIAAADRLRVLPHFATLAPERILAWRESIQRKHALDTVAVEAGFASWAALMRAGDDQPSRRPALEALFTPISAVFLNHWCRSYDEARALLDREGGYLFPYRAQFVVTAAGLLQARGIDAHDPDWKRIGFDWVRPADARAHTRLCARLAATLGDER